MAQFQRHFKVQTAGRIEDIYCNDFDDSDPNEVWFIFTDLPPRRFRRDAIVSMQEIPVPTDDQRRRQQQELEKLVRDWEVPESYEPDS